MRLLFLNENIYAESALKTDLSLKIKPNNIIINQKSCANPVQIIRNFKQL